VLSGHIVVPTPTPARAPGLLFVHGFKSSQAGYHSRAHAVAAAIDAVCFTFDLGGHGASGGVLRDLTPRDHLADALAAFDHLRTRDEVDADRVGVCGASYGAYLAALLISERPVKRLLLRAPALYADDDVDVTFARQREGGEERSSTAVFAALHSFPGEILVVESEKDCVIPVRVIERYAASNPRASRVVIHGARHALEPRFEPVFVDLVCEWFRAL
jgi:pimeloyl-ACP methyl ester carboxylesterase